VLNTQRVALSDLGDIFDGPHATPKRQIEGPYFLNIASLDDGRLDLTQSDHLSREDFERWTKRVTPQEGDLLFSYETRLGDAALMPAGIEACLGRRMALLRPNRELADSRFLLYFYLGPAVRQIIDRHTIHGATVNRIGLSTMGSWPVDVPALPEQRAVAEVLGALDDKITTNVALVRTSDELAGALTRFSIDSAETVTLSEVALITMGSSPPGASYNELGDGTVFYQGVRDFGVRYPRNRVWTTMPVRLAQRLDCLVSVRAPVGELNLAGEYTCIGRGLASVRSTATGPMSLFHLLKDSPQVWAPYEAEGTVFGSINKLQLASLRVPTVRAERRAELEHELSALELRIAAALEESDQLAAARDALLPQLMSGTLRVQDAEKTLEEVL